MAVRVFVLSFLFGDFVSGFSLLLICERVSCCFVYFGSCIVCLFRGCWY